MVMVQLQEKDMTPEQLESEKNKIVEYWADFEKKENIPIKTLLIQTWSGSFNGIVNDDKATTDIMTGDGFVHEEILGCRFRISYNSFFQINTPATELLYKTCADWCNIDESKKSVLLDLCCGTGTIGITMAKSVNKVIGVDIVPEAIVDAKANAERNGITNVEYYASKVEDKLDVFNAKDDEELVAILDPPRYVVIWHTVIARALKLTD
jgi:tRNA (uracil-5-)-methyltransferase